ncbi:hypothetical protein [Streptomyces griseomycini]|uniref:hypothetical protein n=1 Tax=Streptomyces griseomycini TaxID=66895 RepID=UPI001877155F|nr:hypothetical protein [Streptomyces griseomycini]
MPSERGRSRWSTSLIIVCQVEEGMVSAAGFTVRSMARAHSALWNQSAGVPASMPSFCGCPGAG